MPARLVATVGYIGLLPRAATCASLAALPAGWLLHWGGGPLLLALAAAVAYAAGTWAIGNADLDPREIVIDEIPGQWVALMPLSAGMWLAGAPPHLFPWPGWVTAFVFFRLFDVWKPWPVSWADRRGGPTGVMLGDVLAGLMAAGVVVILAAVAHGWLA